MTLKVFLFSSPSIYSRPKSDLGVLGARLLQAPKNIKKNKLAKIHQNLKKSNLGRPMLQSWWLFGAIWTSIFDQFSQPPKSLKLQQVNCENLFFTISGLSFWHLKWINKSCLFISRTLLFLFHCDVFSPKSILGPLRNPVRANMGSQNRPSGAKMAKHKLLSRHSFYCEKR